MNGPAFACAAENGHQEGMSKRFYAACMAMQGLLAAQNPELMRYSFEQVIPKVAFMYADELLKIEDATKD